MSHKMMSCMVNSNVHLTDFLVKYVYSFNTERSLHGIFYLKFFDLLAVKRWLGVRASRQPNLFEAATFLGQKLAESQKIHDLKWLES